jgi:hypothetical protein
MAVVHAMRKIPCLFLRDFTDQDGRMVERITGVSFRQVWNEHTPMSRGESHGMGFLTLEVLVKKPK